MASWFSGDGGQCHWFCTTRPCSSGWASLPWLRWDHLPSPLPYTCRLEVCCYSSSKSVYRTIQIGEFRCIWAYTQGNSCRNRNRFVLGSLAQLLFWKLLQYLLEHQICSSLLISLRKDLGLPRQGSVQYRPSYALVVLLSLSNAPCIGTQRHLSRCRCQLDGRRGETKSVALLIKLKMSLILTVMGTPAIPR